MYCLMEINEMKNENEMNQSFLMLKFTHFLFISACNQVFWGNLKCFSSLSISRFFNENVLSYLQIESI